MTKINDIITDEDSAFYAETAIWCNENNAVLQEIEPAENHRRFKVVAIPEPTAEELKNFRINELQNFLEETDWYAIRFADTGAEIPEDIKVARQSAREEISRLRGDDDQNSDQGSVGH